MSDQENNNLMKNPEHAQGFHDVLRHIQQARQKVFTQANTALIDLYWQVGQTISEKIQTAAWGKGVVSELAHYISQTDPNIKGFSDKNLWRMKQFYETYCGDAILSALLRELPWTHNTVIFSRCRSKQEREFYLRLCIQENYTSRELNRQINTAQFERSLIHPPVLSAALRELHPHIDKAFKDTYILEFLGLPDSHSENDLQKALIGHMKSFILELGKDFIFMGEKYRLQVGNQDFYIDLLFYHRGLSALVAFELKIGPFMPEHIGQLNFYLEALDRDIKKPHENPSIGVLLCRDKDDEVVEYALSRNLSPTLIAQYQLQLPDKKLLQAKMHELFTEVFHLDEMGETKGEQ
jgi:predicted nuclease of restriction endonuclease-like (RecB) superfamily